MTDARDGLAAARRGGSLDAWLLWMYALVLPFMLLLQAGAAFAAVLVVPFGDLAPFVPIVVWAASRGRRGPSHRWLGAAAALAVALLALEPIIVGIVFLQFGGGTTGALFGLSLMAYLVGSAVLVVVFAVALVRSFAGVRRERLPARDVAMDPLGPLTAPEH